MLYSNVTKTLMVFKVLGKMIEANILCVKTAISCLLESYSFFKNYYNTTYLQVIPVIIKPIKIQEMIPIPPVQNTETLKIHGTPDL